MDSYAFASGNQEFRYSPVSPGLKPRPPLLF